MEINLVKECRCGGTAWGYTESKVSESDYDLVGLRCEKCGKNFSKRVKKTASWTTRQHIWSKLLKRWNDWILEGK